MTSSRFTPLVPAFTRIRSNALYEDGAVGANPARAFDGFSLCCHDYTGSLGAGPTHRVVSIRAALNKNGTKGPTPGFAETKPIPELI
ncbi:MAG: hypothetical protein WCF30_10610 [Terracidiphilus sp.]